MKKTAIESPFILKIKVADPGLVKAGEIIDKIEKVHEFCLNKNRTKNYGGIKAILM